MRKRTPRPMSALLLLVVMPFTASAFTIDGSSAAGSTFDVSLKLANGASDPLGNINNTGFDLRGTATFEILSKSNTEISFELTLANTTTATSGDEDLGLHAFGFGSGPFVRVASWSNDGSRGSSKIASVGSGGGIGSASVGSQPIQVTASTDDGSTAAQSGQGIAPGESETFEFQLKVPDAVGSPSQPTINLDPFVVFGPDDNPGIPGGPGGNNPGGLGNSPLIAAAEVPAPGTLALALLGMFLGRRWFKRPV